MMLDGHLHANTPTSDYDFIAPLREFRYTYWADAFRYTCEDDETSEVLSEDLVCGKGYTCPDGYVCENSGQAAVNHGLTGYHDIWHAMLQVRGMHNIKYMYSPPRNGWSLRSSMVLYRVVCHSMWGKQRRRQRCATGFDINGQADRRTLAKSSGESSGWMPVPFRATRSSNHPYSLLVSVPRFEPHRIFSAVSCVWPLLSGTLVWRCSPLATT